MDLTLRDAVSIAGTVRMLDEKPPHVALLVEAVKIGQLSTIDIAQGRTSQRRSRRNGFEQ